MKRILLSIYLLLASTALSADDILLDSMLVQSGHMEFIAKFAAEYAKYARAEDIDKILRLSCIQLQMSTEYIHPSAYNGKEKIAEVTETKQRLEALLRELKAQGYCD